MALHLCHKEDESQCAADLLPVQLRFHSNGRRDLGRLRSRGRVQAVPNQSSVDGSTTCRDAIQLRHFLTDRGPVVADPAPASLRRRRCTAWHASNGREQVQIGGFSRRP